MLIKIIMEIIMYARMHTQTHTHHNTQASVSMCVCMHTQYAHTHACMHKISTFVEINMYTLFNVNCINRERGVGINMYTLF